MRKLVVAIAVLKSVAAGIDGRAESEVVPDERLPTLDCFSVSDVNGTPQAECELVNDTSMSFFFDGDAKNFPAFSIEKRQHGHWKPLSSARESEPLVKHAVARGVGIDFSAVVPKVSEPIRLRVAVYRTVGAIPIPVFSRAVRVASRVTDGQFNDVPMMLCSDISPPKVLHRVEPKYPEVAHRARIQGTVVLGVVIDKNGKVQDGRVIRSIPVLDSAAVSAVNEWRYGPARDGRGHPVAVYFRVFVKFELPSAARLDGRGDR